MNDQEKQSYRFGPFRLDVAERLLLRDGESITLPPKAFETLLVLVQNSGRLVTKKELMNRLWPDAFVEEANLANNVSLIRKALDDDRQESKYIQTVPKSGYRFVAEVREIVQTADATPPEIPQTATAPRLKSRLLAVIVSCIVLAVGTGYCIFFSGAKSRAPEAPASQLKSLAVLPLKPLVGTTRDEYLELGIADSLITRLSSLKQVEVRAIGAVSRYTDPQRDPVAIGREQNVDAVLDGSIQKSDNKIRVSVRLIRVTDGATLLSSQFDENYTDIFAVQDAISNRVAEVLVAKLSGEEKQALTKRYTENIEAFDLYLSGRYSWSNFTAEGLQKAIEFWTQAIEKDPNYASPYVGIASSYIVLGVNYRPPREVMPKAKAYVAKALERDPLLGDAYVAQGAFKYFFEWDWSGAESDFKRAIELGSSDAAGAHQLYSYYFWAMRRFDEGIAEMNRAHELAPLALTINEDLGVAYYYSGKYEEAIQQQNHTIELDSNYFFGYLRRGQAYLHKGMHKEAIDDISKARTLSGNWPTAVAELGCAYALSGQKSKAQPLLDELKKRSQKEYIDPYLIALVYTSMGEDDASFEWLAKAYEARSPWLTWINVEPKFQRVRSDQRFIELLHKVGLPQ